VKKSAWVIALLTALIPVALWASSKTYKKSFTVTDPVQVQNVMLSPGHYEVTWTQMGSNVPVTILQHKKPIVTVPNASVVEQKNPENGAYNETLKEPNGTEELTKIGFSDVAVILTPARAAR